MVRTVFKLFLGGRRAVFRPRGADLGCLAACFAGAAHWRSTAADLKPCKRFPGCCNMAVAARASALSGLLWRSWLRDRLHGFTTAAAPRKCLFRQRFLIKTAELQIRDKTAWPCAPGQKGRQETNNTAPQHASPPSATASQQPHTRGHRAANKTAQASAPPTTKGRGGHAGTTAVPAAGFNQMPPGRCANFSAGRPKPPDSAAGMRR